LEAGQISAALKSLADTFGEHDSALRLQMTQNESDGTSSSKYDADIEATDRILDLDGWFIEADFKPSSQNDFALSMYGFTDHMRLNVSAADRSRVDCAFQLLEHFLNLQRTEDPTEFSQHSAKTVLRLLNRFHSVAIQLRRRHDHRPTLEVTDEHDVQDLLRALLRVQFDDVRAEEGTPSYAGKASRVDFLLKKEQVVIETKKTREGFGTKEIGDELIIDIARYATHPDCKTLVCFVYDPEHRITNAADLEADLSVDRNGIMVIVVVAPKP